MIKLAKEVQKILDAYENGKMKVEEGRTLTPSLIANAVQHRKKMDAPPSTGAVTAVLDRWADYGYITLHPKPKAFKAFTAAGKRDGLAALKEKHTSAKRAATAAAKGSKPKAPAKKKAAKKAPAKKAAKKTAAKKTTKKAAKATKTTKAAATS